MRKLYINVYWLEMREWNPNITLKNEEIKHTCVLAGTEGMESQKAIPSKSSEEMRIRLSTLTNCARD